VGSYHTSSPYRSSRRGRQPAGFTTDRGPETTVRLTMDSHVHAMPEPLRNAAREIDLMLSRRRTSDDNSDDNADVHAVLSDPVSSHAV